MKRVSVIYLLRQIDTGNKKLLKSNTVCLNWIEYNIKTVELQVIWTLWPTCYIIVMNLL